jgi:hypothetical protein
MSRENAVSPLGQYRECGTSRNQEGLPRRHRVHREEILNPKLEIPDNIENPKFKHLYFDIVQNLEIRAGFPNPP